MVLDALPSFVQFLTSTLLYLLNLFIVSQFFLRLAYRIVVMFVKGLSS